MENAERHVQMIRILAGESIKQILIVSAIRDKEFSSHNAVYTAFTFKLFDGPIEINFINPFEH